MADEPTDPESFTSHLKRYFASCQAQGYTETTIKTWTANLRLFTEWCSDRGLTQPKQITYPILSRYQRYLVYYRRSNGDPISTHTQGVRLSAVKGFFKWLTRERYILYNPASELQLPKKQRRLPKAILTEEEINTILDLPDVNDPYGLRDRAILEVLYSTGIRRMELVNLMVQSIDQARGIVFVEQGKGQKDRVVPIGDRALDWVKRYMVGVRPELVAGEDDWTLFLTQYGERFSMEGLSRRVKSYIDRANLNKTGSCHLFRHAMATHMLENGADIRYIQEILGHSKLETTQIYTQVSILKLKEIHRATHPAKVEGWESE
ncbi:site-specific tyrosine recombinase XerC [Porticoccus sp. W117]|uniref:site-specific tyrosine recombinase XerC n=1 Tax=Porticoccus sp. W117 TaxID=3054777 RepID=UPI002596CF8A|nr:site-specific tyrosine recombinase XerC [Porticoccus sp. W117]MDM3872251.1 site-specific tyrosine recombinase XerC [Porticoccus sp. W117]MDM3872257.1 site-specific tyrosine recombinase XerC [Porticoccus sp. W117]